MKRRDRPRHRAGIALITVLLITGCGGAPLPVTPTSPAASRAATAQPSPSSIAPPPAPTTLPTGLPSPPTATSPTDVGRTVDVGGYRLSLHCGGAGGPTVVFDSGWGGDSRVWEAIFGDVQRSTRACVYDRAGLGRSDPGPLPRTSARMVAELHTLLANEGERGPFLLVGHSFGGFYMRLYAGTYPREVAGLLLVDSSHEDQDARTLALLPAYAPDESPRLTAYRDALNTDIIAGPEPVAFKTSAAQVRAVRTLGALPLVVLRAGRTVFTGFSPEMAAPLDDMQHELQRDLAGRSTNSCLIVAERSGHYIPCDQPALVAEVIRSLIAKGA